MPETPVRKVVLPVALGGGVLVVGRREWPKPAA